MEDLSYSYLRYLNLYILDFLTTYKKKENPQFVNKIAVTVLCNRNSNFWDYFI